MAAWRGPHLVHAQVGARIEQPNGHVSGVYVRKQLLQSRLRQLKLSHDFLVLADKAG